MQILIIGSGAREHALAKAVVKSPLCRRLFVAPGNPGMADIAMLVPFAANNVAKLVEFADAAGIDFVIVGPEEPLALGIVDELTKKGILAFGPTQAAARLESSKAFTKAICRRYDIPTAAAEIFTDAETAKEYLNGKTLPIVIKADGLAAGKGVTIARTLDEADAAIDEALTGKRFGEAGATLVIEEFLDGEEVSFFALCDGNRAIAFGSAQDHKAAYDGDTGPNTGGMGAYSPTKVTTPKIEALIMRDIIEPTLIAMNNLETPFRGVLFAGLMIVSGRPYLIEHNVRFGDPECEVLMARLGSDIVPILMACAGGDLGNLTLELKPDAALTVIMASNGYPGDYKNGSRIENIDKASAIEGVSVLHAGTKLDETGALVSHGGRVLAVTATGPDLAEAQARAYRAVDALDWKGGFCRRDIGWRGL
jgi:phosphoribosylamine--glycine ligase